MSDSKIIVTGGHAIDGEIRISGAKNAALPLMAASLLTADTLRLTNMPHLSDVITLSSVLSAIGADITFDGTDSNHMGQEGRVMEITVDEIDHAEPPADLVQKMRASVLTLGPLTARCHEATVTMPGGCVIGKRPIDFHLSGLEAMGATVTIDGDTIHVTASGGLTGASYEFPVPSVTGTENLMMAATLSDGQTVLSNVAQEPEIVDLGQCLIAMGAKITGLGSDMITINGVDKLHGTSHPVVADRIETGSYAIAPLMTYGKLTLTHTRPDLLTTHLGLLRQLGADIEHTDTTITITKTAGQKLHPVKVATAPYPGFPTDLQAQLMVAALMADGQSKITETIWEDRFNHVPELNKMGGDINVDGRTAIIHGSKPLHGATVMATDLRASACLILAGLAADGQTTVTDIHHLDRGYERLCEKLNACGAMIKRL
jgi:UDP-N-acetylglucosamine 1-carboxyvinyltransferase